MARKVRRMGPPTDPQEIAVCEADPQFVATGEALLAKARSGAVAPHVFINVVAHAATQALWRAQQKGVVK